MFPKNSLLTVLSFLSVASLVLAQTGAEPPAKPVEQAAEPAVDVLAEKVPPAGDAIGLLLKPVKEIVWDETPFEDVLEWLRDESNDRVNVLVRWGALNDEGVDAEKSVSLKLTNTTVGQVLNEVLESLSDEGKLRYQASTNQVLIATQAYFDKKLILKVYNIGDILFRVPDFSGEAPQIDLTGQSGGGGGGGGGGAGGAGGGGQRSVFSGAGGGTQQGQQGQNEQETEEARNRLRDLILVSVVPESWADQPQGGGASSAISGLGPGRIRIYNRSLVVLNTLEVHEQLAGWIELNR